MLISIRDHKGKLMVKDILDIDFDMYVESVNNKFIIRINHQYRLDEEFDSERAAEDRMLQIAGTRNKLEEDLAQY